MKIVFDKNMPYAAEAFATLGDALPKNGRDIAPADVRDAELLFTRSTTMVNAALLDGSAVRFCGSGVIGTDHIDIPYLNSRGIVWRNAPGCNAESVGDYITAALLWLGGKHGFRLEGKTIGVIGVGNVGRCVCRRAKALGMRVLANDPPRQRDPADAEAQGFVPLERLLAESDIVTCHVPLTREGPDATWHLLDAARLAALRPGAVVINAARGPVTDTAALLRALDKNVRHVVIDCWEGEPGYRPELLRRAELATPHIAGHSYEGKVNGTAMVYRGACAFLGRTPDFRFGLPPSPLPVWRTDCGGRHDEDVLRELVLAVYDIEADSRRLKESCCADAAARAAAFEAQRVRYPVRREFSATSVAAANASDKLRAKILGLGFGKGSF